MIDAGVTVHLEHVAFVPVLERHLVGVRLRVHRWIVPRVGDRQPLAVRRWLEHFREDRVALFPAAAGVRYGPFGSRTGGGALSPRGCGGGTLAWAAGSSCAFGNVSSIPS